MEVGCSSRINGIFKEFLNKFIDKESNSFMFSCPNLITGFVITNGLIDWTNHKEVEEEFKDATYNYFVKLDGVNYYKHYRPYKNWWKQEYLMKTHFEKKSKIKKDDCSICLEPLKNNVLELKCGHQFCGCCIDKCFEDDLYPNYHKCPLCRTQNKKWFPFAQNVYQENSELEYKNCPKRFHIKMGHLFNHFRCNQGYSTSTEREYCYACEWNKYQDSVEEIFWDNGGTGSDVESEYDEMDYINAGYDNEAVN